MAFLDSIPGSRMPKAQARIQNAFVRILGAIDYNDISVTDICHEAEVNRKTFYDYYQNKQDVYESLTLSLLSELCGFFMYEKNFSNSVDESSLRGDIRAFLEFIELNNERIMVLLNPTMSESWSPLLAKIIEGRKNVLYVNTARRNARHDIPAKLITDTITSQLVIWLYWWLSQNEYSIDEGTEIVARLISRSTSTLLRYSHGEGRRLPDDAFLKTELSSDENEDEL